MQSNQSIRIHTSVASAQAIKNVGEIVVSANWKETKNQTRMERAVVLPMECLKAPEVPESFRALVEAALLNTAEKLLKDSVNANPNSFEILSSVFDRPNMVESFISSGNSWINREELEKEFVQSATWKRISGRPEFQSNKLYQNSATQFKELILKLSAKTCTMKPEVCDLILSKLEDSDLNTEFGGFVLRRLETLKAKEPEGFDLSAL